MLRSWRLGKLFAIPVYLHPSFLIVPVLALLQNRGSVQDGLFVFFLVLSVFGCVLLHEFGHALMARWFGIGTSDITLYVIGGVARLHKMGNTPQEELLIALAGPAVNLAIVLLLSPLAYLAYLVRLEPVLMYLVSLGVANLILMGFNLLPIFPMDGGRVLRALLSMGVGQLRATEIAASVALGLAAVIAVGGVLSNHLMLLPVALFVVFAGQQELYMMRQRARALRPLGSFETVDMVAEQGPASEPPPFRPTYWPSEPGFSGFTWDREYRVWVKWINGQPVATMSAPS
jgi:Zn-dependent protease